MGFVWNQFGAAMETILDVGAQVASGTIDAVYNVRGKCFHVIVLLLLHIKGGDISYSDGYGAVWEFFMDQISPIASAGILCHTVIFFLT